MIRPIYRSLVCGALAAVVSLSAGQSMWEKRLAPGLLYRQEVDTATPRVINALRLSPGSGVIRVVSCLAKDQVFDDTPEKGRETVSSMVKRKNAVAGINGDFFQVPYTGDPLGAMVLDGELLSNPNYPRSAFGWGEGVPTIGMPVWKGTLTIGAGAAQTLDGLNENVSLDKVDLEMPVCGQFAAKTPNIAVFFKAPPKAKVGETLDLEVDRVATDYAGGKLAGEAALVAAGTRAAVLAGVKAGDHIKVNLAVEGFDWSKIHNVMSGGPRLIHEGKIGVTWDTELFRESFSNQRHPRTAIGWTESGEMWFVTVDGRQKHTDGATLQELAEVLKHLGCAEALNLDGGGSSDLACAAGPFNRPSDGAERPVASALLLIENPTPSHDKKLVHTLAMRFPGSLAPGGGFNLSLVEKGVRVPNSEIVWMSAGDGWVDQGGTVRAFDAGSVKVIGYARGTRVETVIPIGGAAPQTKPTATKPTGKKGGASTGE